MFIQVIEGRAGDEEALRGQFERWLDELAPGAEGWLGSTAGFADDGGFIAVVRFESEEAARRNSDRSEQGRWWEETAEHFADEVKFSDYADVEMLLDGGSDDAGFVQVLRARASDIIRVLGLNKQLEPVLREYRPEVIGGTFAYSQDGDFTETVYFSSEAEAREGEKKEAPEFKHFLDEWTGLVENVRYIDLHEPLMWSP